MSASDIGLASAPAASVGRMRVAVVVPLALAFIGLAVVAGIGAGRQGAMLASGTPVGVDPVVTGSVVSADEQARAMRTLDR
jgi:hypothetical protein